jgi:cytochrome c553
MLNPSTQKIIATMLACTVLATVGGRAAAQSAMTPEQVVERALHVCNACHGEGGDSKVAIYPKLAGQPTLYLADQLRGFRTQKRADSSAQAYMWGISALLDENTIEGLAEYYAAQTPTPGKPGLPAVMEKGQRIFKQGIPARKVLPCSDCHGEKGEGDSMFPRIAGQHADYIVKQLNEFRTKLRPHGGVIAERVVKHMEPDELRAVATYLQAMNP